MTELPAYEKLGVFYLGRKYDLAARATLPEPILYDSKDMTTHAMCVGMTGSGKTGLCLAMLEEAAIDGIPAIALDPKGDLGNLLLTFPDLKPSDFQPWLESSEATRQGLSLDELAEKTATTWREGLAKWDQTPDRIERLRQAVDVAIYTPGSNAGLPLTVLKSFDAPPAAVMEDPETLREKISSAASGLLTLLSMEADPLTSREHILLSNIFNFAWQKGENLSLPELIRQIQTPPIQRVGVLDLDSFLPPADRNKLAMSLNNLLASPAFAGWLEGEPLDIKRLLYTADGKPRLSIISISHLNDSERMFFVTLLLGELIAWMRTQAGTSSLRAMFYMDEVFGYFPPNAKPPSKQPMLLLLKQARAFGLGIMLATQNPVDLDYKGLSNMGTWFLGRLQTERDKMRVLEGLEGAAIQSGAKFDRGAMEQTLASLGNRVFLMNNVHDDQPTIFQSRWALSFLRGPLSRQQIQSLMNPRKLGAKNNSGEPAIKSSKSESVQEASSATSSLAQHAADGARPILPAGITERFLRPTQVPKSNGKLLYRPALLGQASQHFVRASSKTDLWQDYSLLLPLHNGMPEELWQESDIIAAGTLQLANQPEDGWRFDELPAEASSVKKYASWEKQLKDHLYRHHTLQLYFCKPLDLLSQPGETETDVRLRLGQLAREQRDRDIEKVKVKYSSKFESLRNRLQTANAKLEKEKAEANNETIQSVVSFGSSILGALLGNKVISKTNMTRAGSAAKSIGKAAQQRGDVARAEETVEQLQTQYAELELQFEQEREEISRQYEAHNLPLETIEIPARKSDIKVKQLALVWVPWQIDSNGIGRSLMIGD